MDELASLLNDQLKELKEAVRIRGRINLLVAGKTGVGKSTLINAVFRGNFALLVKLTLPPFHTHCRTLAVRLIKSEVRSFFQ